MKSTSLYSIENLAKVRSRESVYSLNVRHLSVYEGDMIAVTGQSGCGKSTLLDLLGLVLKPDKADEFIFRTAGKNYDAAELWRTRRLEAMACLRRMHIGYILQTGELIPFINVGKNVLLAAGIKGAPGALERAERLMEELDISHLRKSYPKELSIGERQRAAIARALASSPEVILADEPTSALDPMLSRRVMDMFVKSIRKSGTTLVMVSHDLALVDEFGLRRLPIRLERHGGGIEAVLDDRN